MAATALGLGLVMAACSDESTSDASTTPAPTSDPSTTPPSTEDAVAAAEARVLAAQQDLAAAEEALRSAGERFCSETEGYIVTLDRYGKLFTDSAATVGDVTTAGADLAAPRDAVASAAGDVAAAQADVESAAGELAAADAALAAAKATASSVPTSATSPPSTTTTTLVPPSTITRVQQAEGDLTTASAGITDVTPLTEATAEYNAAAFALEIAWLRLLADAGCLTDEQQADATAKVVDYTLALQTDLQRVGRYGGEIDGIYGPLTVDGVTELQTEHDLRATGFVDQATRQALDEELLALDQRAIDQALTQTAALQTVLTLTGYWTGPIDGTWSPQLTDALKAFQTDLGVEPSGAVDPATLAAFHQALADLEAAATATTTVAPTPAPPPPTRVTPTETSAAPTATS